MRILCIALLVALTASCVPSTPQSAPAPRLSAQQLRDDTALLGRLERDLADLEATRNVALAAPPFDRTQRSVQAELQRVDREMTRDAALHFPTDLGDQSRQNLDAYRNAIDSRNQRALQLAQMQANERESSVAFAFERAHNRQFLDTKLRLQMPHLMKSERVQLQRQLATLQAEQAAAVAKQRSADEAQINSLSASLAEQTASDLQRAAHDLRNSRGVKISAPKQTLNTAASIAAVDSVSADISARLNELRSIHQTNVNSLSSEIAALRAQCDRLKAEISRSSRDPGAAAASSPAP